MFDIYTIIFLALAVFIFLRLRSVLGQRTGRERPPYDPYSARPSPSDKVVVLPGRAPDTVQKQVEPVEPSERWKGVAEPGSAIAAGLDAIAREDKSFEAKPFLVGSRAAYEMIVTAYAAGDRRQLKKSPRPRSLRRFRGLDPRARAARRDGRDAVRVDRRR